jgi:hypothetical protein
MKRKSLILLDIFEGERVTRVEKEKKKEKRIGKKDKKRQEPADALV